MNRILELSHKKNSKGGPTIVTEGLLLALFWKCESSQFFFSNLFNLTKRNVKISKSLNC